MVVDPGVTLPGPKPCRSHSLQRTLGESHLFIHRDFSRTVTLRQVRLRRRRSSTETGDTPGLCGAQTTHMLG